MSIIINNAPGLCGPYEIESKPMTSAFSTLSNSYKQLCYAKQITADKRDNVGTEDVGTDAVGVCYTFWYSVRGERDEGIIKEIHFISREGNNNV